MHWRLVIAASVVCGTLLPGQQTTTLTGRVVRAGSNSPVSGAEVTLDPRGTRTITDAGGEYRFERVPVGHVTIFVRRIGFQPESLGVLLPMASAVDIEIKETVQTLDTVSVAAKPAEALPRGKLAGFYERRSFGIGRFLEAKDLEQQSHRRMSDILTARLPGTRALRSSRGGSAAFIATTRMTPNALLSAQQGAFSGGTGRPPPCYASVYLDGAVVYTSGTEQQGRSPLSRPDDALFDINSIDASAVAAIEFYSGAGQMPAQYNRTGSTCGVLLIWTK